MIRTRHGQHLGLVPPAVELLGQLCKRLRGPTDDRLVRGVVVGNVRSLGKRRGGLLDRRRRRRGGHQRATGRGSRFNRVVAGASRRDHAFELPHAGRRQCRKFTITVSRDQIGLDAHVGDRRVHDDVGQQHHDLRRPDVGAELLGMLPRHLSKRLIAALGHDLVEAVHGSRGGRHVAHQFA